VDGSERTGSGLYYIDRDPLDERDETRDAASSRVGRPIRTDDGNYPSFQIVRDEECSVREER
jgi:hypothetical protein